MAVRTRKPRLGQLLKDAGVLSDKQLRTALEDQRQWGGRLGRILVDRGFMDEETMVHALCRQLELAAVHLDSMPVDPEALDALSVDVVERYHVFPVSLDRKKEVLRVASSDPTSVPALEALTHHSKRKVLFCVAGEEAIARAIRRHYHFEETKALARKVVPEGVTAGDLAFSFPATSAVKLTKALRIALDAQRAQASARMGTLEKIVEAQGRALRSMLELLDREGVIHREQFLDRMHGTRGAPPPLPLERTRRPSELPDVPLPPEEIELDAAASIEASFNVSIDAAFSESA